jgi:predicted NBD/HSP70 family sugar kinase
VHRDWAGFDIRGELEAKLGQARHVLERWQCGALWGHFSIFGASRQATSISAIVGTGLGGGVIVDGNVVKGRVGFGGELGHVLIPYQSIRGVEGLQPTATAGAPAISSRCAPHRDRKDIAALLPAEVSGP